jgi:ferredoxin-thioredoxin reductase catalytic subunit/rubredoxin
MEKEKIDKLFERIQKDAQLSGYNLNPDTSFTKSLMEGLLVNQERYGYQACPCRLASGEEEKDLDIICPCDYRDPDLDEYGACYCALYVDEEIKSGKKKVKAIPDRRFETKDRGPEKKIPSGLSYPVWRCKVCGYLCARDNPPAACPVCKAQKERFEVFIEK